MGSDLARISFDSSRGYRSVVAQQGRVTLEADINEETAIASEALRLETIDIVGPAGTPDDGYSIAYDASDGLYASGGTMYVGGWRVGMDGRATLFNDQEEWLDQPAQAAIQGNAIAALLLTEQSIGAVEDQALREVALGGPDTAARTRLMQHLVLIPTSASQCADAEKGLGATLKQMGLWLNPASLELVYAATLQVSFFPPAQSSDPCCPPAQGGYLGADNQLVRVAVSDFSAGSGTLLWGWNNASFLYRATAVSATVLQLSPAPVDAAHAPQPGQVIEILQTTMVLGDAPDDNYVAAPQGTLVTLGSGTIYDPTTQQLTLPAGTSVPSDPNTIFVRLWQGTVPFTSGTAAQLDSASGLAVTVKMTALPTAPLVSRPYWCFAVRPNTPQNVYPARYQEDWVLPDGPRQWLCDLAVVQALPGGAGWKLVEDCRKHFKHLIDEGDCTCCALTLSPDGDWVTTLNAALNKDISAISICFQPGVYMTTSTITFSEIAVKITGAGEASAIRGKDLEVVFEFDRCPDVVVSDISVAAGIAGYSNNRATIGLQGAVTIRECPQVDIERVFLSCVDADLRAASCLAVYNPAPAAVNADRTSGVEFRATPPRYNLRVLNSQFKVGHFQVGILVVNADRAQIEGNFVITPQVKRNLKYGDLAGNIYLSSRLKKQLLHAMTIVDTAPAKTKKAQRRMLRKLKRSAGTSVPAKAEMTVLPQEKTAAPPDATPAAQPGATAGQPNAPAGQTANADATGRIMEVAQQLSKLPHVNLGAVGRARVTATFGTLKLEMISSDKLGNAWADALTKAGLNQNSTARQVHTAVHAVADMVFTHPETAAPAFRNYVENMLPNLYSTSSQGIVVGGNVAGDVRILNNTVEGMAQGIHVGLSDRKASPYVSGLQASVVQICGNTVKVRLTAEMTGDRHGIYLGSVKSAVINDNHVELARGPNAGQDIYGIKVAGVLGRRVLIERNATIGFTCGIYTQTNASVLPQGDLWKAADNVSTSPNATGCFKVAENVV